MKIVMTQLFGITLLCTHLVHGASHADEYTTVYVRFTDDVPKSKPALEARRKNEIDLTKRLEKYLRSNLTITGNGSELEYFGIGKKIRVSKCDGGLFLQFPEAHNAFAGYLVVRDAMEFFKINARYGICKHDLLTTQNLNGWTHCGVGSSIAARLAYNKTAPADGDIKLTSGLITFDSLVGKSLEFAKNNELIINTFQSIGGMKGVNTSLKCYFLNKDMEFKVVVKGNLATNMKVTEVSTDGFIEIAIYADIKNSTKNACKTQDMINMAKLGKSEMHGYGSCYVFGQEAQKKRKETNADTERRLSGRKSVRNEHLSKLPMANRISYFKWILQKFDTKEYKWEIHGDAIVGTILIKKTASTKYQDAECAKVIHVAQCLCRVAREFKQKLRLGVKQMDGSCRTIQKIDELEETDNIQYERYGADAFLKTLDHEIGDLDDDAVKVLFHEDFVAKVPEIGVKNMIKEGKKDKWYFMLQNKIRDEYLTKEWIPSDHDVEKMNASFLPKALSAEALRAGIKGMKRLDLDVVLEHSDVASISTKTSNMSVV